jgi:peroxiredoxin
MKQIFIWFFLIGGIASSIYLIIAPATKQKDVPKEILSLPSINLLLTDSQTIVNTTSAIKDKAIVVFYFDPGCSHCQKETEELVANKEILNEVNFYFVSIDSMQKIKSFEYYYRLKEFNQIIVAKDHEFKGLSTFKVTSIPTNIVYNNKHKLVKIFVGEAKINDIKDVLKRGRYK